MASKSDVASWTVKAPSAIFPLICMSSDAIHRFSVSVLSIRVSRIKPLATARSAGCEDVGESGVMSAAATAGNERGAWAADPVTGSVARGTLVAPPWAGCDLGARTACRLIKTPATTAVAMISAKMLLWDLAIRVSGFVCCLVGQRLLVPRREWRGKSRLDFPNDCPANRSLSKAPGTIAWRRSPFRGPPASARSRPWWSRARAVRLGLVFRLVQLPTTHRCAAVALGYPISPSFG